MSHTVSNQSEPASGAVWKNVYIVELPHSLFLIPIRIQFLHNWRDLHDMTDEMKSEINFRFLSLSRFHSFFVSFTECIIHQKKKRDQKAISIMSVYVAYTCVSSAVIFPRSQSWRYAAGASSFLSPLAQGLLHCVTIELKGGICDLISPGNIKEKLCFIHRHKAPEFTQIKFARLCLRDQARGLTHIEMIGFLRHIKEEGGRENVTSSGEDCAMFLGDVKENRCIFK